MKRRSILTACLLGMLPFLVGRSFARSKSWDAPRLVGSTCSGCHGVDGNAPLPYIPKLAGLQASYTEKKLNDFREPVALSTDEIFEWARKRASIHNAVSTRQARVNMLGISLSSTAAELKKAALWYEKQIPARGHGADSNLAQSGRDIFLNGVPAQHILACKSCHGEKALGDTAAPRLASQNSEYLVEQLQKFRAGDRKHAPEMTQVARDLDDDQARAVAAYLHAE